MIADKEKANFVLNDEGYEVNVIARCRGCERLLAVHGQWEGDDLVIMTTTSKPIFGRCPYEHLTPHPSCADKYAAVADLVEVMHTSPQTGEKFFASIRYEDEHGGWMYTGGHTV